MASGAVLPGVGHGHLPHRFPPHMSSGCPTLLPVCKFWLQGRCTRHPCPFLHCRDPPPVPLIPNTGKTVQMRQDHQPQKQQRRSRAWRNSNLPVSTVDVKHGSIPRSGGEVPEHLLPPSHSGTGDGDKRGKHDGDRNNNNVVLVRSGDREKHDRGDRYLATTDNGIDCATSVRDGPASYPPPPPVADRGDVPSKEGTISSDDGSPLATHCDHSEGKRNAIIPCGNGQVFDGRSSSQVFFLPVTDDGASKNAIICREGDVSRCQPRLPSFRTTLAVGGSGYQKAITGIALPSGHDKLFSGSADGGIRVLDCHSGRCIQTIDLGGPVSCIITEGSWVFVGSRGAVHCCNVDTRGGLVLPGPGGMVCSLATSHDMLLAGVEDGSILAWKAVRDDVGGEKSCCFRPAGAMRGHTSAVVSLAVGRDQMLYSGSMDGTIRAWHLEKLQCTHTASGHTDAVTSLVCWEGFLLSCSLDGRIMVWAPTTAAKEEEDGGSLKVVYTHSDGHGALLMCATTDLDGRPVILCSLDDSSVRKYELPSFSSRGFIVCSRGQVSAIHPSSGGVFFTGSTSGEVNIWRCSATGG